MTAKQTIKVLLVDDHPFILEGLRSFLRKQENIELVGEAATGQEAIEKAKVLYPSVVIMDISMPGMNGVDATKQLRTAVPDAKVLALTVHEKGELFSQIIQAGARGYVSKNSPPSELVRAVEAVHRGETFFRSEITRVLESAGKRKMTNGDKLSMRECEVLAYVAAGFSNEETSSYLGISVRLRNTGSASWRSSTCTVWSN